MKSVLISIQPKWCELIATGKKTVEVRKTRPKIETPFKVYIYETKSPKLKYVWTKKDYEGCPWFEDMDENEITFCKLPQEKGKVIGEFVCDEFTYIEAGYDTNGCKHFYNTALIEHRMCIPDLELFEYLYKSREKCGGWGWHISDLVIYDEPKELGEFLVECKDDITKQYDFTKCRCHECKYKFYSDVDMYWSCGAGNKKPLSRPPQSWCYVEGKEDEGK